MAEVKKEDIERVEVRPEDVEDIGVHGSNYKKPMSRRFADIFISDQADTVGSFIVEEVIIPGVKDALLDILHGSIDRIFGGTAYGGYNSKRRQDIDSASWRKYHDRSKGKGRYKYDDDDDDDYDDDDYRRRRRRSYDESVFSLNTNDKAKKNRVMERLTDIMRDQRFLSIYDVKVTLGFMARDIDPTDQDWGWDDIRDMRCYRDYKGKYIIELPRPDDISDIRRDYYDRIHDDRMR